VHLPILAVDIFGRAPGPDRKRRLAHYLSLGSLRQYVLLAPHQPSAMLYSRDEEDDGWYQEAIGAHDLLHLTSVSLAVPLAALYEGAPEASPESDHAEPEDEPGLAFLPDDD